MAKNDKDHGCTKGKFLVPIQKALEEGELSGIDLFNKSKEESKEAANLKHPKSAFNESLHCLLVKKIIQGYYEPTLNPRQTRHTSNFDYYIFSLVKKDPIEILHLINNAISGNDLESYNELKELYTKKVMEIDSDNEHNWKTLLNKVHVKTPNYKELLWHEADEKMTREIRIDPELYDNLGMDGVYQRINSDMLNLSRCTILNKNTKTRLYLLKILKPDIEDPYEQYVESLNPKPKSISEMYLFTEELISKEDFLETLGYAKPKRSSHNDINKLYKQLISYINIQESGRAKLIDLLSIGLSEQENSDTTLHDLVYKATNKKERIINYKLFIS